MGKPINKKYFGDPDNKVGKQVKITAKLSGESVGEGYIIKQTGKNRFKVHVGSTTGEIVLVNTVTSGNLSDGEGYISSTPHGGSAKAVKKLMAHKLVIHDTADSATSDLTAYKWSGAASAAAGEATLMNDSVINAKATATGYPVIANPSADDNPVDSVTITSGGGGYATAPAVTFSASSQTTATGTAVLTGDVVTSITITNAGSYTDAELAAGITVTIAAP